jgi:uncharacterized membrane protein YgcG
MDKEAICDAGQSPLDVAVLNGHVPVARHLLEVYEEEGKLEYALFRRWGKGSGHASLIESAVSNPAGSPSLSPERDELGMVRLLVKEKGAPIHTLCNILLLPYNGASINCLVLHYAASMGKLELVKFFCEECGMDVESKANVREITPLQAACLGTNAEEEKSLLVIKYLVEEKGADVRARIPIIYRGDKGEIAAMLALDRGRHRIHAYLMAKEKEAADAAADALLAELEGEDTKKSNNDKGSSSNKAKNKKKKGKGGGGGKGSRAAAGGGGGGGGGSGAIAGAAAAAAAAGGGGSGEAAATAAAETAMRKLELVDHDADEKKVEATEQEQEAEEAEEQEENEEEFMLEGAPESYICCLTCCCWRRFHVRKGSAAAVV